MSFWEKIGPGVAFETLTLAATLGWRLFTTAAAYVCTEREGLQTLVRSLSPDQGKNKSECLTVIPKSTHQACNSISVLVVLKKIYVPRGLLSGLLGKVNMHFSRLRVSFRCHIMKQAAINVMK